MSEAVIVGISPQPAPQADTPSAPHRLVLPAIRDITLIATIYLFFAGYSYRAFYLEELGIHVTGEASLNTILVDAFAVIVYNWWLAALLLVASCALSSHVVRDLLDKWLMPLVAAVAVGGFFVLDVAAAHTAAQQIGELSSAVAPHRQMVMMAFKDDSYEKTPQTCSLALAVSGKVSALEAGWRAYLMFVTSDTYFVYVLSPPPGPGKPAADASTYAIPRSGVVAVKEYFRNLGAAQ
jgi:hypothetical protein